MQALSLPLSLSFISKLSRHGKRVAYGVVGSAVVGKFLADELVHPGFLLVIIVVVGAHEAWDDEGHGGLRWLRVQLRGVFSVLILISKKAGDVNGWLVNIWFQAAMRLSHPATLRPTK